MRKDEKGQSLVEFALLLPIILLLLVGIIDFGRVLYSYSHLHMATQETVRLGGLGSTDEEMTTFAQNYIHIGDPDNLTVSISPSDTERDSGEYVTVHLTYPVELHTPFLSSILPSPVMIKTDSTIRVE
ncbi:Flp pilus assembly protein TadG [Salirhabdus euzebyi]|uniref:Flp pilus assembly protein TadG n=1 Tax=Salirhabdus euzebyi TaxID=394506 RepID=A0A841QA65_9BACI|nr:TadE/TadG family type IV pilus assembly protein [Salirhabdus euzebyi]MBB6455112.1 Flp pilus assembly protein TadG [Salirhabdus euzebyi]